MENQGRALIDLENLRGAKRQRLMRHLADDGVTTAEQV